MGLDFMIANAARRALRRCAGVWKAIPLLLLAGAALTSSIAQAADGSGLVKWVGVQHCCGAPGPYFIVKMTVRGASQCADPNQLFAALLDERGKAMYAMVLGAYLSGTPLSITGKGTCNEVRVIVFEDIELVLLDQ